MIHRSGEVGIRKCDAAEWRASQRFSRRRFPVFAKKESRLWIAIRVSPPIQNNPSNVALRIEPRPAKHQIHLLANTFFVLLVRSREHFSAAAMSLFFRRQPRVGIQNLQGQHDRRVRRNRRLDISDERTPHNIEIIPDAFKPSAPADTHLVQKSPVAHRYIRHHARRPIKLRISATLRLTEVSANMLCRPTSARHHRRPRLHSIKFPVALIRNRKRRCLRGIAVVLHRNHR